ncbi:MAG: type 1 glutamine amidotransferase, partial [Hyphomicrobiales bacterium]
AVRGQIELAREAWRSGVPGFGSCWGQQIMCQALGGEVRANPKGIEIGVARRIALNPAGAMHPMYAGKGPAFDALAIHKDEVVSLPGGATALCGNGMSEIQGVFIAGEGDFWGVQYHPEFDLHMIATLLQRDKQALVKQGLFTKEADVADVVADFEALHEDPARGDLAWRYGIDADVLDPKRRMAEFGNWLKRKVLPRA